MADAIKAQGDVVRGLKTAKASQKEVKAAVEKLLTLKKAAGVPTGPQVDPYSAQATVVRELKSKKAPQADVKAAVQKLLTIKAAASKGAVKSSAPKVSKAEFAIKAQADIVRELKNKKASQKDVKAAVEKLLTLKGASSSAAPTKAAAPSTAAATPATSSHEDKIAAQGEVVRALKAKKAPKDEVKAAVEKLLALKKQAAAPAVATPAASSIDDEIKAQGDLVRELKSKKAPKDEIKAAVEKLLALKKQQAGGAAAEPVKKGQAVKGKAAPAAKAKAAPAKEEAAPAKDEKKTGGSSVRRDTLLDIQGKVQAEWAKNKVYEVDAPADGKGEKFFGTFPYPYMNGVLHLGHAFSLSKLEFTSRYQRLLGKRVLFPFGLHCTGMPIAACADRLKREVSAYGNPPIFPAEDENAPKKEEKKGPQKKKKLAKKASTQKSQWGIMNEMGVPASEISKFQDAEHWLQHFPSIALDDLASFGLSADFRRSFITTDINPYYDSFIRWQFNTLRAANKVLFGSRMSIFSTVEQQNCADHDRSSGEGVGPQEYTLIKLQLLDYPEELAALKGKKVFLPAATLRPETMYGQTNLFVLPEGLYGAYQMNNDEVFVCSERSAKNMAYQRMMPEFGKLNKLAEVLGEKLIGKAVKGPLAKYDKLYILPLLTILMDKGTGVVTSVPSDSPDDYAALEDLKKKKPLREKYGLTDEMVLPFEHVCIIDTPGLGSQPAVDLCIEMKVQSQNDKAKLEIIKEKCYTESFYKGRMIIGEHAGKLVSDAKPLIKAWLIKEGMACSYAEPEKLVMSRSGQECVVALTDQWYLAYGEESWRSQVEKHLADTLECYNPATKKKFEEVVAWLKEWGCSRSYGLGTKLPWDQQFVIESLSDSTIYMAYYTVCNQLQGGANNLDGNKVGPAGITAQKMTHEVWDYLLLNKAHPEYPAQCGITKAKLDSMRNEFEYWYPMDLRVSGKDLIGNHLTMTMYNHAAIWKDQPEMWPRSYYTNGHLMINAEKMSKSTGNFMTLIEAIKTYGADATRLALADAGDTLLDANFEAGTANSCILRLTKEEGWYTELQETPSLLRTEGPADDFMDKVFENEINRCIKDCNEGYASMQFHNALKAGYFELSTARDQYRTNCTRPMHKALVDRYMEASIIMLSPICPHWCQHMWKMTGRKGFVIDARFPEAAPEDLVMTAQYGYLRDTANNFRSLLTKQKESRKKQRAKAKQPADTATYFDTCVLSVASAFPDWQRDVLLMLAKELASTGKVPDARDMAAKLRAMDFLNSGDAAKDKKQLKTVMAFAAQAGKEVEVRGAKALALEMPFDEVAFLQTHKDFVTRDSGLTQVVVQLQSNDQNNVKDAAVPGKPKPTFFNAKEGPKIATTTSTPAPAAKAPKKVNNKKGSSKKNNKKSSNKKKKGGKAPAAAKGPDPKQVKACIKEGGKKGQDLGGMSTFGCHYFLTTMIEPDGDMALLELCMQGANKEVDPEGEDRKGGAGDLAKVFFSAGDKTLSMLCHVPKECTEVTAREYFEACLVPVSNPVVVEVDEHMLKCEVQGNPDKGVFPLKLRDECIARGFEYLRSKNLILDDDSDDDENYADAAGVDLNGGAGGDY